MNRHARINRQKDKHQMKTNADATTTTEAGAGHREDEGHQEGVQSQGRRDDG
jgi:hypothetical protein